MLKLRLLRLTTAFGDAANMLGWTAPDVNVLVEQKEMSMDERLIGTLSVQVEMQDTGEVTEESGLSRKDRWLSRRKADSSR